jgi:very-short-patch-repair endonuclease
MRKSWMRRSKRMTSTGVRHIGDGVATTKEAINALALECYNRSKNFWFCESENLFLHHFYRIKAKDVSITGQVKCQMQAGRFRVDFVSTTSNRKIGFECDGKKFHEKKRDQARDAAILEAGLVDIIYRVPGRSIWLYPYEVLDLLRCREPQLFSERGNRVLNHLLNDEAEREDCWSADHVIRTLRERVKDDGEAELLETYESPDYISLAWKRQPKSSEHVK